MHVCVAGKHCQITEECAAHKKVTQWTILVCICSIQAAVKLQCESIMLPLCICTASALLPPSLCFQCETAITVYSSKAVYQFVCSLGVKPITLVWLVPYLTKEICKEA